MQKQSLICTNFSGINRSSSVFSSSLITATDMQNVELFASETNSGIGIRTAKGNTSISTEFPDGETVVNIFESVQKSKSYFFVHTETLTEGKIYLFNPDTERLSLKVDGLSLTGESSAIDVSQGWSDLWVFSNGEEMFSVELEKYDSNGNLNEITFMNPVDTEGRTVKGLGMVVFAGRLWVFNKQILWYSVQENIYDFSTSDSEFTTSAGYIEFVKNITAIYPYLGTLAVFHSNSSCMIANDEHGFYKTLESPGGCAGYKSLVFHGTQLYFYDNTKKGVFSFLQVVNGDKTLGENIAIDVQQELLSLPVSGLNKIKAVSVVTSDRNEVWFLVPNNDENYSSIMIYDYLRKTWIKRKSQKINCAEMINGKLFSAGKKIYEEYSSDSFDGEYIESYYKCAPMNLGVENSLKILAYPPKITLDMYYDNDFYIEYTKDYNASTLKTKHIKSKTVKAVLYYDRGFWDKTKYAYEKVNTSKSLPSAYFKTLQITFLTKDAGQNFCINNIEFGKIKVKA